MALANFGQREKFTYLGEVLGVLCEMTMSSGDELFRPTVDRVEHGVFRIAFEGDCALIVDTNRNVTDDPGMALPEQFPGRLPITREYRLNWRDSEGLPVQATVEAASRRFARLFADAPEGAYVERV
jgi:hypothetical protein